MRFMSVYKFFNYSLEIPNYIDIFTSGIFFTAMWYMALKKIENWTLWIIGDVIAVPLFAYRGLGMLSLQYIIFTIFLKIGKLCYNAFTNGIISIFLWNKRWIFHISGIIMKWKILL